MEKLHQGERNTFASRGGMVLAIATMVWSVCLLGGGLWWFIKRSGPEIVARQAPRQVQRFSQVQEVPTGLFRYGGSPAWAAVRLIVDTVIQSERREFQLRYVQSNSEVIGARNSLQMLLDGDLDIVQSAHPLAEAQRQQAQEQGSALVQVPVAISGIAIAVHPQLPVSELTLNQLRSIYQGEVTNWQELGGPNLDIQPYSRPSTAESIVDQFQATVLQGASFGKAVAFLPTTTDAIRKLNDTPGGIYYASASELVPQCTIKPLALSRSSEQFIPPYQSPAESEAECLKSRRQVNINAFHKRQYPLTHNLYVVFKGSGPGAAAGKAYAQLLLTKQGQDLMQSSGFAPIDSNVAF
ncbi:MAG: PstS family phosphate ABC transporter substrate-binding protein [Thermosynechococcaceae cyanobacterium]